MSTKISKPTDASLSPMGQRDTTRAEFRSTARPALFDFPRAALAAGAVAVACCATSAEPVRILRVGDSIMRLTAMNPVLQEKLRAAGLEVDFVGTQKPVADAPGTDTDCEAYNGRSIEFFTTFQKTYGDEPYSDNCVVSNAVPLQKALVDFKPHVVLAMVGVNNLGARGTNLDVAGLTAKLETFCDRLEEWSPAGARYVFSTVPPANGAKNPENPQRNLLHQLYNEQVVRPVIARRIAAGKPYTLADPFALLTPDDLSDNVHPNRKGKERLNAVWAEAVLQALGRKAECKQP